MVTDLADMMVERLKAFQEKSRVLPKRILVYRDGVSEVYSFQQGPRSFSLQCD